MPTWFKNLFFTPSANEVARREYAQAQLALLEALSAREYADAIVSYNKQRTARLKALLDHNEA